MTDIIQTQMTTSVQEVVKTQTIRVADVFIVGPLMIFAGWTLQDYKLDKINRPLGFTLMALGVGTILLNGKNYFANQKRLGAL